MPIFSSFTKRWARTDRARTPLEQPDEGRGEETAMEQMELELEWTAVTPAPLNEPTRRRARRLMARCILAMLEGEEGPDER